MFKSSIFSHVNRSMHTKMKRKNCYVNINSLDCIMNDILVELNTRGFFR